MTQPRVDAGDPEGKGGQFGPQTFQEIVESLGEDTGFATADQTPTLPRQKDAPTGPLLSIDSPPVPRPRDLSGYNSVEGFTVSFHPANIVDAFDVDERDPTADLTADQLAEIGWGCLDDDKLWRVWREIVLDHVTYYRESHGLPEIDAYSYDSDPVRIAEDPEGLMGDPGIVWTTIAERETGDRSKVLQVVCPERLGWTRVVITNDDGEIFLVGDYSPDEKDKADGLFETYGT